VQPGICMALLEDVPEHTAAAATAGLVLCGQALASIDGAAMGAVRHSCPARCWHN
jgi:hypothetical protein